MKVELAAGIKSLSGSIKQKNGSRIVFKTFSKPSVNRKSDKETRMYLIPPYKRTSPVTKNELRQRTRFAQAADLVAFRGFLLAKAMKEFIH